MKQTIFYGWRIVLVALIGQFLSVGSLLIGLGLMILAICAIQ